MEDALAEIGRAEASGARKLVLRGPAELGLLTGLEVLDLARNRRAPDAALGRLS